MSRQKGYSRSGDNGGACRDDHVKYTGRHSSAARGRKQSHEIGYKVLCEWQHFEGPDVIVRIFERYKDFKTLLSSDVTREINIFKLTTHVLARSCETTTQMQKKYDLLAMVKESVYFKDRLTAFIRQMAGEDSRSITDEYPDILISILSLSSHILHTLHAPAAIPVADIRDAIEMLEERSIITEENHKYIFDSFKKLSQDRKNMMREATFTKRNDQGKSAEKTLGNFRDIKVVPGIHDLTGADPTVRCNIVQGPYNDSEHYLDTMFRLHREDLVRPLRASIASFRSSRPRSLKFEDRDMGICYTNVVIMPTPDMIEGEVRYTLCFNLKGLDHVDWKNTRRLMYGCLLCLSCDNFTSVLMATVASRDYILLKDGRVKVYFENISQEELNVHVKANKKYVMIESTAYYEAYKYVLRRMQNIQGNVPFEKYLVHVEKNPNHPEYIRICHSPADIKYNLSCIMKEDSDKKEVFLVRNGDWPGREKNWMHHSAVPCSMLYKMNWPLYKDLLEQGRHTSD